MSLATLDRHRNFTLSTWTRGVIFSNGYLGQTEYMNIHSAALVCQTKVVVHVDGARHSSYN